MEFIRQNQESLIKFATVIVIVGVILLLLFVARYQVYQSSEKSKIEQKQLMKMLSSTISCEYDLSELKCDETKEEGYYPLKSNQPSECEDKQYTGEDCEEDYTLYYISGCFSCMSSIGCCCMLLLLLVVVMMNSGKKGKTDAAQLE